MGFNAKAKLMNEKTETKGAIKGDRIAKVLARAGVASRREAEKIIADKRVSVNGKIITTPALNVLPSAEILLDGQPIAAAEPPKLWRYHKPRGLVTTERDPQSRPTVFAAMPEGLGRLLSVGRLDINTQGLLLMTNHGGLKRHLELPDTGWLRRYRVRAFGRPDMARLNDIKHGVVIDRINYRPVDLEVERQQGDNFWLNVSLREGKNREIKKLLEYAGLQVNRLIRLSFGPFQLGHLDEGAVEEVPRRVLRQQLGTAWADIIEGRPPKRTPQRTGAPIAKKAEHKKEKRPPRKTKPLRKATRKNATKKATQNPWEMGGKGREK